MTTSQIQARAQELYEELMAEVALANAGDRPWDQALGSSIEAKLRELRKLHFELASCEGSQSLPGVIRIARNSIIAETSVQVIKAILSVLNWKQPLALFRGIHI